MFASRILRRLAVGPAAIVGVGLIAFGLFFGLAATSSADQPIVSSNPQVIATGQDLFNVHCSACHGVAGVGVPGRAPSLVNVGPAAADFYLITGRMPLNSPTNQAMRHTPFFDKNQIEALVSYVAALPIIHHETTGGGPGIPTILPLCKATSSGVGTSHCVTLSLGQQTFALNCAPCHQISGAGGMLSKGVVVPSLKNATPLEVAEAIRIGPRPMPFFGPGQLNQQQVSALAHYVAYVHRPVQNGGLGISNFGPVAEGFVGILFGLGALLFIARMMGTRG